MQDCIAKYQSRDTHVIPSAKSNSKCCVQPVGVRERHIFGKCGTNLNVTGSEFLAYPESLGV